MARGPRGGGGTFLGVCLPYFSFLWSLWCSFFFFFLLVSVSPVCFCASMPLGPSFHMFRPIPLFLRVSSHLCHYFLPCSVSPSLFLSFSWTLQRSLLHLPVPSLPGEELGTVSQTPARSSRLLPARGGPPAPESAAPVSGSCPFRGRGSPWGGSGLELGQESTGCIRTSSRPGRRPLLRAGGRAGRRAGGDCVTLR